MSITSCSLYFSGKRRNNGFPRLSEIWRCQKSAPIANMPKMNSSSEFLPLLPIHNKQSLLSYSSELMCVRSLFRSLQTVCWSRQDISAISSGPSWCQRNDQYRCRCKFEQLHKTLIIVEQDTGIETLRLIYRAKVWLLSHHSLLSSTWLQII